MILLRSVRAIQSSSSSSTIAVQKKERIAAVQKRTNVPPGAGWILLCVGSRCLAGSAVAMSACLLCLVHYLLLLQGR